MTAGNKFYAVLDPYNLTQTIDGVALDPIANYNIMWVLPTVYWSTDESGEEQEGIQRTDIRRP